MEEFVEMEFSCIFRVKLVQNYSVWVLETHFIHIRINKIMNKRHIRLLTKNKITIVKLRISVIKEYCSFFPPASTKCLCKRQC